MYDNYPYAYPHPYDGPRQSDLDRLTHLVLVDGRLVDVWSEPVSGTRWQEHAERFDRAGRSARPTASSDRRARRRRTPPQHEFYRGR